MEQAEPGFPCRLCGATQLSLHYTLGNAGEFRYYRCGNCRLVNLDLSAGLDQTQCNLEFLDPTDESSGWDKMIDATFAFAVRHAPDAQSLCDIGCGNGRLLTGDFAMCARRKAIRSLVRGCVRR